jgi:lipase
VVSVLYLHHMGDSNGRPLLAIHGVMGHGLRWRRVAAEGLPSRSWTCPDLRGHGRSPWEPPWSIAQHVDDVIEVLDFIGAANDGADKATEPIDVVGHSYGANLAAHLASAVPHRVRSLTMIDPAIHRPADQMLEMATMACTPARWPSIDDAKAVRRAMRPEHAHSDSDLDVDDHIIEVEPGQFGFRLCAPAIAASWGEMANVYPSLAAFGGPVTLIAAGREQFVNDELRHWLAADVGPRLLDATIDSSHMIYWDAFDELVAVLRPQLA